MAQNTVTIEVAKRRLKVACPQGQESALLQAAKEVSERLESTKGNIKTPEQNMLMVALNLANEMLLAKQAHQHEIEALESKIGLLQSTFEQALQEPKEKSA